MPSASENLVTRRDAICAELAAMGPTKAGGLPNAAGSNAIDEVGYKDGLYRELKQINEQLAALSGEDCWEIMTEVDT